MLFNNEQRYTKWSTGPTAEAEVREQQVAGQNPPTPPAWPLYCKGTHWRGAAAPRRKVGGTQVAGPLSVSQHPVFTIDHPTNETRFCAWHSLADSLPLY